MESVQEKLRGLIFFSRSSVKMNLSPVLEKNNKINPLRPNRNALLSLSGGTGAAMMVA
jgi:hypothetical protein